MIDHLAQYTSPAFSPTAPLLEGPELWVQIGLYRVRFCLYQPGNQEILLLEEYRRPPQDFLGWGRTLLEERPYLSPAAGIGSVRVMVQTGNAALIPAPLFTDQVDGLHYLRLTTQVSPSVHQAMTSPLGEDIRLVFALERTIVQALSYLYEGLPLTGHHQWEAQYQAGVDLAVQAPAQTRLHALVEENWLSIWLERGGEPLLANCYRYRDEDEFVYACHLACYGAALEAESVTVQFQGQILPPSVIYRRMFPHFPDMNLAPPPLPGLHTSLSGIEAHQYLDLFWMARLSATSITSDSI